MFRHVSGDGYHSYAYDADGNLISVDNPAIATDAYDSLNQRVREAPTRVLLPVCLGYLWAARLELVCSQS